MLMVLFCPLSCGQKEEPVNKDNTPIIPVIPQGPSADDVQGGPGTRGWTTEVVSQGLLLHKFDGNEIVTGKRQSVRVLDVDMDLHRYRLEFACVSGSGKTGSVLAQERGAVASVNATFETHAVYIKIGGIELFNIQDDKIINSDIENWKNDGAFYMRNDGSVYLEHSGKGKSLREQRSYYRRHTCPNIFSSAPMLIDDYEQVGEKVVPEGLTSSQLNSYTSAHIYVHSGVTHPRTVFATTEDNRLLLVAIDKDRTNGTVAGMTVKEMTQFMKYHFNPQYALSMDGGGSTAISVKGKVVNTPSDPKERSVPTYLLIYDNAKK